MRSTGELRRCCRYVAFPLAAAATIVAAGFAVQALALPRAKEAQILAARAVGELSRLRLVASVEHIHGRPPTRVLCLQQVARNAEGRHVHGAFVMIRGGGLLYDTGHGVYTWPSARIADALQRVQFDLAGCPQYLADHLAAAAAAARTAARRTVSDGTAAVEIRFAGCSGRFRYFVGRLLPEPLVVGFRDARYSGWSDVEPSPRERAAQVEALRDLFGARFFGPRT